MATDSVARAIALAAKANSGKPGPVGPKGDDGLAATIQVGTVTTGAAGTNAEVTNVGTENAAIFNFTIPKGDPGEGGGGLSTIVAGTGTSSIVMNHDDTNTNVASGNYSTALGYGTKAAGQGALAAGYSNTPGNVIADEGAVCCIGRATGAGPFKAKGDNSIAIGASTLAQAKGAISARTIAIGTNASAFGIGSVAIGSFIESTDVSSIAIGSTNASTAYGSIAIGSDGEASGTYSTAIGYFSKAKGDGSIACGKRTIA